MVTEEVLTGDARPEEVPLEDAEGEDSDLIELLNATCLGKAVAHTDCAIKTLWQLAFLERCHSDDI